MDDFNFNFDQSRLIK